MSPNAPAIAPPRTAVPHPTPHLPTPATPYAATILAGCLGPFAVVRAPACGPGKRPTPFPPHHKLQLERAVRRIYGSPLPIVYLTREANGYRFDAPANIAHDVGLVMEDLASRQVIWHDLPLDDHPQSPLAA